MRLRRCNGQCCPKQAHLVTQQARVLHSFWPKSVRGGCKDFGQLVDGRSVCRVIRNHGRTYFDSMQTLTSSMSASSRCCMICHCTQSGGRSQGVPSFMCLRKRKQTALTQVSQRYPSVRQAFAGKHPLALSTCCHVRGVHTSATATQAESIAFQRPVEAEECEEEDFYSILGVVRNVQLCSLRSKPSHA